MYCHTKFDHQFEHGVPTTTSYVVCSTPRCGSSLLCEALCNTGLAGAPTEYFDQNQMGRFRDAWKLGDTDGYLEALMLRKTGPNGVFGIKSHYHQLREFFGESLDLSALPNSRFIWIGRRDVLRQAVSYARAVQTNQWASTHESTNPNPQFDLQQIRQFKQQIEFEQLEWQRFFERIQVNPLIMVYEEFSQNLLQATKQCLDFLDIEFDTMLSIQDMTLRKQADHLSDEWIRRYLELAPT